MTAGHGLLLSDDLIFTSRIVATAKAHGGQITVARSTDKLLSLATEQRPSAIILDLQFPMLQLDLLISQLQTSGEPLPRLVGYGSHVDVATLKAARAAGVDPVMPRSQFVEQLESAIAGWLEATT